MDACDGTLKVADNIVIDRDNVAYPRRGLDDFGTSLPATCDRVNQVWVYKDRTLRHYDSTLQYDSDGCGTYVSFNGTYAEICSGLRLKSIEQKGNLYFNSTNGIYKISATANSDFVSTANYILPAGGPKGLDLNGVPKYVTACGGFMTAYSKAAYRIVWGYTDANNNCIIGAPSQRYVLCNPDQAQSADATLTFSVPTDVLNCAYYYKIYRSPLVSAASCPCPSVAFPCLVPEEEYYLVCQQFITTAQVTAGTVTVCEITCEAFRASGELAYFNATSGQGILQANDKPPIAKDLAEFKGSMFYANTQDRQRKTFSLIGTCSAKFTSGTTKFIIGNSTKERKYTYVGATEVQNIIIPPCGDCANSLDNTFFLINSASNERKYAVLINTCGAATFPSNADTCGRIQVPITVASCATQCTVATNINTAFNLACCNLFNCDFTSTVCGATVTVTWAKNGNVTDTVDATAAPCQTGFTFPCPSTQGDGCAANTANGGCVLYSSLATPGQSIDETGRSLVRMINGDKCCGIAYAYYLSGACDLPGKILLEARNLSDPIMYLGVEDAACKSTENQYSPTMDQANSISAIATGSCVATVTSASHGLTTGKTIFMYDTDSTPVVDGPRVVTVTTPCAFTVPVNITCAASGCTGSWFLGDVKSDNEVVPNRIYFSKTCQPEAVPLLNYAPVGAQDKPIQRILALRDNLIVLKEDGVYLLTGTSPLDFRVQLLDASVPITAPDSAVVLNNQIFMLSTQGVVKVSDTKVEVASRDIEDKILCVTTNAYCFKHPAFGVAYESDRAYYIWLPTISTDTVATQAYRYNTFNDTWTRNNLQATAGIVNPVNDKLYIGAGDRDEILQERKNKDRTDYADQTICITMCTYSCIPCKEIRVSSVVNVKVGDVIAQEQFVTSTAFNRTLKKLDLDPGLTCTDYFGGLPCFPCGVLCGGNIGTAVQRLNTKLTADDCGGTYPCCLTVTTFANVATSFNLLTAVLNGAPSDSNYTDYETICATTASETYEAIVTASTSNNNTVTLSHNMPFHIGAIKLYKGITSIVEWNPQCFGDASIVKQIRQGTLMFDGNNFYNAEIAYASDLSQNFDSRTFSGKGPGWYGGFGFGCTQFGGCGSDVPQRDLIPQQKQKCRYITPKFTHRNAREDYSIVGISFDVRAISKRGYR